MCKDVFWVYAVTVIYGFNFIIANMSKRAAIPIAMSRKGPWNLSRTLATQAGMTNKWLKNQGVPSIKELWVNIHYPATAR
jgi:RNA-directed DNA polymerase